MEGRPNQENVHYIDEYPELKKRVWLRRLAEQRLGATAVTTNVTQIFRFEAPDPPDGAA